MKLTEKQIRKIIRYELQHLDEGVFSSWLGRVFKTGLIIPDDAMDKLIAGYNTIKDGFSDIPVTNHPGDVVKGMDAILNYINDLEKRKQSVEKDRTVFSSQEATAARKSRDKERRTKRKHEKEFQTVSKL